MKQPTWQQRNREKVNVKSALWSEKNPERRKQVVREYYLRNREKILKWSAEYARRFPEKKLAYVKAYQKRNPEKVLARAKEYRKNNPDKVRESKRRTQQKLMATNSAARIKHNLRSRIGVALRSANAKKAYSTMAVLGCSVENFRIYLESQWEPGMSWENYGKGEGKWQIDHIMPCAIFDLTRVEHQKRCFHFSNQRPMWADENNKKKASVVTNQYRLI